MFLLLSGFLVTTMRGNSSSVVTMSHGKKLVPRRSTFIGGFVEPYQVGLENQGVEFTAGDGPVYRPCFFPE